MDYLNSYRDLKKREPKKIRSAARRTVLDSLSLFNIMNRESLRKNRIQFLYFHHIFDDEISGLENLLNYLSKDHSFISFSEAVERITSNRIDKSYIVFSSDDGFRNNLNGIKLFKEYGVSCCFFLNPGIINSINYSHIKEYCQNKLELPPVEFLSWDDIETLQKFGHEIGSHTVTHINLGEVTNNILKDELYQSKEILEKYCGEIKHFAFPYGTLSDFSLDAFKATYEAEYISCSSAVRGCHVNEQKLIDKKELFIRRDQVIFAWKQSHIKYFLIRNAKKREYQLSITPV